MKKVLGALAGIVVLAGIAIFLLLSNINGIVKNLVESVGSDVTGTSVSLGSADIDLRTGKGTLLGLTVSNPDGYGGGEAFEVSEITLEIDVYSIGKNPLIINQIVVDGATVNYIGVGNKSNLQTILDNVKSGGSSGSDADSGGGSSGSDMLLIIDDFRFTDASMSVALTGVPEASKTLVMQDVTATGVGRDKNGVPPAEATAIILQPVLQRAVRAAADELSKNGLDRFMDKVKDAF